MQQGRIDVFALGPSSNLRYLTGYAVQPDERLLLLLIPAGAPPFILANVLYRSQVGVLPVEDFVFWTDGDDPFLVLKEAVEKRGIPLGRMALEPRLPAAFSLPLGDSFPQTQFLLGTSLTAPLRQYKDRAELDLIRQASRRADQVLTALMDRGNYWLGRTEAEFNGELEALLRKAGLVPWEAIVAAGENGAVPHHSTGNSLIEAGKGLIVDFGGSLGGYNTDCTRTFHFGRPGAEFEAVYRIVLEAQLAAEGAARRGNTLGDVDAAARGLIEQAGYGAYFTHRTGHGIGIDIHEGASADKGEGTPLEPGMVFSIEPGIYLPGRFGVRIENLVAITGTGTEILHRFPRELRVIT
jgi:Xaa-Pro aminopeptidase